MKLADLGEFGLIARIAGACSLSAEQRSEGFLGIGDDCALLPLSEDQVQLVTADLLVENVHFLLSRIKPEELGYKSLAVSLSDIAAMGGVPTAAFLSISLPKDIELDWLDHFFEGVATLAREFNCPLLGGDTTRSNSGVVINFTVLGRAKRSEVKFRSGAKPGDLICVTGFLGDSAGGLKLLLEGAELNSAARVELLRCHHRPRPQLAEGGWLGRQAAVSSMLDLSDGLSSDLLRIMERSRVGAQIALNKLPISGALQEVAEDLGWSALELAVTGGEDYHLMFTVKEESFAELRGAFTKEFGRPVFCVGQVTAEQSSNYLDAQGRVVEAPKSGFKHFG